jgi:branched-chain amino acid transport system ATP-binding protein
LAGWLHRDDSDHLEQTRARVLDLFPSLVARLDQRAGDLSGGEQQMLGIGMAMLAKPQLLMIDELSLGLAPVVVEQLMTVVREVAKQGTAVVLVEQSLNVAMALAERVYFLEKGEVRFAGGCEQLVDREDLVRAVFLPAAGDSAPVAVGPARREEPADGRPLLQVEAVRRSFGGITAVDGADLCVERGEIVGLIGANGAGKTTVLDLISGYLPPDSGTIVFDGIDITALSPDARARLGLGRSFQDARLIPSLSVAENIAVALDRHLPYHDLLAAGCSLPLVKALEVDVAWTVADLIELMHLGDYRDKLVRDLSTGSRRVVDLAMAIAHAPTLLLLDEPAAGIAQREVEALAPMLRRIRDEAGCALLVVEHDIPLVQAVCDRLVALDLGVPIADGAPAAVVADPRVVAAYVGGDPTAIGRSGNGHRRPAARKRAVAATEVDGR